MPAIDWLAQRYPDLGRLPPQDTSEVTDFFWLWSVFEGHKLNRRANVDTLRRTCRRWERSRLLGSQVYDDALAHFRQRYVPEGEGSLDELFRNHPQGRDLVEQEINGAQLPRADRVAALFVIILRLRNNLFHGQKIVDGIVAQRENFVHANNALRTAIEAHPAYH